MSKTFFHAKPTFRNTECCILAVASLQSILRFDDVFKNVFREVGMLEVLVALLQSYSDYLKSFTIVESTEEAR